VKYTLTYKKPAPLTDEVFSLWLLPGDDAGARRAKLNRLRDRFRGWLNDIEGRGVSRTITLVSEMGEVDGIL
jgi:hypothetical protein